MKLDSPGKISDALKRFGVKQSDFALELGTSYVHVSRQLRGISPLSDEQAARFSALAVRLIGEKISDKIIGLLEEKEEIEDHIHELQEESKAFWADLMDGG